MFIEHNSTPVVILGAAHHAGLAMVRSLGRFGVPVYTIDHQTVPAVFSRYSKGFFRWNLKTAPAKDSLSFLVSIAGKMQSKPILICTTDQAALFVLDHRPILEKQFIFPNQLAQTSHALASKSSMFKLAKQAGIPTAETFLPQSRNDVITFLRTAAFPLILKADDCGRPGNCKGKTKSIVYNREQLLREYDQMQDPETPNLVIQEYIPGGEDSIWMFNGYFDNESECLFGMTGKKIRQCPVYTGASCLGVCIQNTTVHQQTLDFMKSVGYRGILDIGYRYDARDGKYKVLDVNPRIGSTFRLFVGANGMDVLRALYLDLTGQRVPWSPPDKDGRKWIVEDFDLISSLRYYWDGNLKIQDWARSFSGVKECSFLSLNDPLPMFSVFALDMLELWSRMWKLRPSRSFAATPMTEPE